MYRTVNIHHVFAQLKSKSWSGFRLSES